jgi:hypothetical protein
MIYRENLIAAPLARWSSRIAVFSASLLLVAVVLHRLTSFPTPVALNLFYVGYAAAGLAVLVSLVAAVQIWRNGYAGAGNIAVAILLPLLMVAGPLVYLPAFLRLPPINDVTTDIASPPNFSALAPARRESGANRAAYPGEAFARVQQANYPDLRTLVVERSAEETFELAEEAARKLKWRVQASEPPKGRPASTGTLEATDQTLVVGFIDDIVVRVEGNATRSRVDVRSASRYGRHDIGQNATRVRQFMAELQLRVDSTGPAVAGRRGLRTTRAGVRVKGGRAADPGKGEGRNARGRARSSAQRGQEPRATQR